LVSYDFGGAIGTVYGDALLVIAEIREDLLADSSCLRYSIPEPVREAILEATAYAMLQLRLFPLLKSRYTAQLYLRLAGLATSPDHGPTRRWEVAPLDLTRMLSCLLGEDGGLHAGNFLRPLSNPLLRTRSRKTLHA